MKNVSCRAEKYSCFYQKTLQSQKSVEFNASFSAVGACRFAIGAGRTLSAARSSATEIAQFLAVS